MNASVDCLRDDVMSRIDSIELKHPYHRTKQFKVNSYEKWACKEILREIQISEDLPYEVTALDILHNLKKKMDSAPGYLLGFAVGADLVDEFIAKYESLHGLEEGGDI